MSARLRVFLIGLAREDLDALRLRLSRDAAIDVAGEEDDRDRRAERLGGAADEIGCPRPQGGVGHRRAVRHAREGVGGEGAVLLVSDEDVSDRVLPGQRVVVGQRLEASHAERVVDSVALEHGHDGLAAYFPLDVTDEAATAAVVRAVVDTFGRLDALVHAAGVLGETPDPMRTSTAEFERVLTINATGTFTIVRESAQATDALIRASQAASEAGARLEAIRELQDVVREATATITVLQQSQLAAPP